MKIKSLLIGMLACTALVGCTNNDDIDNVVPENNEKNLYAIKINLNFPKNLDQSSRALDGFDDGTDEEHNVKNCIVRFYDATKKYLGSTTMTENDFKDVATTDNITKAGEVTFRSVSKPAYVVAIVNDRAKSLGNITENTIDDLKNMVVYDEVNALGYTTTSLVYPLSSTADVEGENFLMTNSTYKNNGEIIQEVRLPEGAVVEIEASMTNEDAFAEITTPAEIYVERVVAKVNLNMSLDGTKNPSVEGKSGVYQLHYTTTGAEKGDLAPYAVHVLGWGLNGTNKSFYPLKRIQSNWEASWYGAGRSFWANDKNHTSGTYLTTDLLKTADFEYAATDYDLNYRTLDEIIGDINTPEYCYENTVGAKPSDNSVTHAVIKVKYMEQDANGNWNYVPEGQYVYRINQVVWNETNFKKHIASYLIDKYIYKEGDVQLNQDALAEKLSFSVDAVTAEVSAINMANTVSVYEKDGKTQVTSSPNWKAVANPGRIVAYEDGFCYYTIPIKHFEVDKNAEGHYGVVRNHWYELTVTSIAGFGEPGTNNPIIPEEEQLKDWAVKCNINILAWSKVTQDNIEVGGGATWN